MAHGKANGFSFHGPGNAFIASIDFFEGTTAKVTSTAETYRQWHACFMFAAFGIILSLGAFIGTYLPHTSPPNTHTLHSPRSIHEEEPMVVLAALHNTSHCPGVHDRGTRDGGSCG